MTAPTYGVAVLGVQVAGNVDLDWAGDVALGVARKARAAVEVVREDGPRVVALAHVLPEGTTRILPDATDVEKDEILRAVTEHLNHREGT